ncbi:MAG: hypothetical protein IJ729_04130, partial [Alloprevotella sp.]|nr:hypothetical protein [Alloprevotella sp.]
GNWYLIGSENVTITYPGLAGLLLSEEEPGEEITFEAGGHSPIWEFECTTPWESTAPVEDEPISVKGYLESFVGDGFMSYLSTDRNLQCGEAKSDVVIAHANAYAGRYTLYVNNSAYTHCGSTAHFTGNTAISEYSTPYIYRVEKAETGTTATAKRIADLRDIKNGRLYAFVGHAKKDGNWYLIGSENVTITYPGLAGILVSETEPGDEIEIEVGEHAPVWRFVTEEGGGGGEEPAGDITGTLQSKADGKYMTVTSNAGTGSSPAPVKISATANEGVYNVLLPDGRYLYCGTKGYFSANSAATDIWFYDAGDGALATQLEMGKDYVLVGLKNGAYYAVSSEVINPGLEGQRMLNLEVTVEDGKITVPEDDKFIWTLGEMPEGEPSFFSAFMGSMRYYSNSIEGDVSVSNSKIVQALVVYIYKDRVVLKIKNYGSSGNFGGIQINPEIAAYTVYRTVRNAQGELGEDEGPVDAIQTGSILPQTGKKKYHDLAGRRISKPGKGVYIVNGKKVLR